MRRIIWMTLIFLSLMLSMKGIPFLEGLSIRLDFLLVIILMLALWIGVKPGAIVGLGCGLLVDISVGNCIGLYSLIYGAAGLTAGLLRHRLRTENFMWVTLLCLMMGVIKNLYLFGFLYLLGMELPTMMTFLRLTIIEAVSTALLSIAVFYLLFFLNRFQFMQKKSSLFFRV